MIAITLHNFPEGMAVGVSLRAIGYSQWQAFRLAYQNLPTFSLLGGFGLLMCLDATLG